MPLKYYINRQFSKIKKKIFDFIYQQKNCFRHKTCILAAAIL